MILNYRNLDWKLIGVAFALSVIGILLIMSATHFSSSSFERYYYQRQALWLCVAMFVFAVIVHLPFRFLDLLAYLFYAVGVILLALVLVIGHTRLGASRWFDLGPISLSPSDVGKIGLLLALARFFAYTRLPVTSKRRLALSALLMLVPALLVLKQPDLGTSLVFFVVLFALWFWSGLSPLYLLLIVTPIASLVTASHWLSWAIYLVALLVFLTLLKPGMLFSVVAFTSNLGFGMITPFMWNRLADYQKSRIITFLDPGHDPRGAGYQIIQSKIAIGSGGLWGKGFLSGSQAKLDFLPERHTDFIFSVLGEEFGLLGCLIVIVLFGYLFFRCLKIAVRCRSRFASYLIAGATAIIFFQFVVNIGMAIGIMPVTGLPLPFLSYGGTALVLFWTLIALIVSADYNWQEY
ncbi:MAG: rod shape-determining protein RodA [candidate division Zixibacteria bacterium]|nr:rod shape-determining protein RodA [candidate division Zixibacteria bacterium]